jgi:hypothetical protein
LAIETYTVQLERVQGLIKSIEESTNASVQILGRSWTKHDLGTLYAREKELRAFAAREANGGKIKVRQIVPL